MDTEPDLGIGPMSPLKKLFRDYQISGKIPVHQTNRIHYVKIHMKKVI